MGVKNEVVNKSTPFKDIWGNIQDWSYGFGKNISDSGYGPISLFAPDASKAINRDEINYTQAMYGEQSDDYRPSKAKHMTGASNVSDHLTDKWWGNETLGDAGSFALGLANEKGYFSAIKKDGFKDATKRVKEDISANWKGTFGTPYIEGDNTKTIFESSENYGMSSSDWWSAKTKDNNRRTSGQFKMKAKDIKK